MILRLPLPTELTQLFKNHGYEHPDTVSMFPVLIDFLVVYCTAMRNNMPLPNIMDYDTHMVNGSGVDLFDITKILLRVAPYVLAEMVKYNIDNPYVIESDSLSFTITNKREYSDV